MISTPRIPFTKSGYKKLLTEKEELLSQRPGAVENLRLAREMGDLSENGYYKAARSRLSFLDARLRRVEKLIKLGQIVEANHGDKIDIGSSVVISDGSKQFHYMVVGGYESDPSQNTISYVSPLGKALIGRIKGDRIEVYAPKGTIIYTIVEVK